MPSSAKFCANEECKKGTVKATREECKHCGCKEFGQCTLIYRIITSNWQQAAVAATPSTTNNKQQQQQTKNQQPTKANKQTI